MSSYHPDLLVRDRKHFHSSMGYCPVSASTVYTERTHSQPQSDSGASGFFEIDGGARLPPGTDGSSWPGADDTTRHGGTTVAKAADKIRPPGVAKWSAMTESDIAVSVGEAGFLAQSK